MFLFCMFYFLDAKLFKDAFEEAQRILEQNRNLPDDETSDESEDDEVNNDKGDEEEGEATSENKESYAESDVIKKLSDLKVESASEKTG